MDRIETKALPPQSTSTEAYTLVGKFKIDTAPARPTGRLYREILPSGEVNRWLVAQVGERRAANENFHLSREYTATQMKSEYVALQLYKALGLPVVEAKIVDLDGTEALAVGYTDLANRNIINAKIEVDDQVRTAALALLWTQQSVPQLSLAIQGDELVFQNAATAFNYGSQSDQREDIFYHYGYFNTRESINRLNKVKPFGTITTKDLSLIVDRLKHIDNDRIVEIVCDVGLSQLDTETLIGRLLENKMMLLEALLSRDIRNEEKAAEQIEEPDSSFDQNPKNKLLAYVRRQVIETVGLLKNWDETQVLVDGLSTQGPSLTGSEGIRQAPFEETVADLSIRIDRFQHIPDSIELGELFSSIREVSTFKSQLTQLKKASPRLLSLFNGRRQAIQGLEKRFNLAVKSIQDQWNRVIGSAPFKLRSIMEGYATGLGGSYIAENDSALIPINLDTIYNGHQNFDSLDNLTSFPTSRMVAELGELVELTKSSNDPRINLLGNRFNELFNKVKGRREAFINACVERQKAVASHVSTHELAKIIIRSGSLHSALRQKELKVQVFTNSPEGSRNQLPQLVFAINGAEISYGGSYDEIPIQGVARQDLYRAREALYEKYKTRAKRAVGFVWNYSELTRNKQFCEFPNTQSGVALELHLFAPEYTKGATQGVEASLEKAAFLVPEEERTKWEEFLLKPLDQQGGGKDQMWVEKHLRTYPRHLEMASFLRYWDRREELDLETQESGIPIPTKNSAPTHLFEQSAPHQLFTWSDQAA